MLRIAIIYVGIVLTVVTAEAETMQLSLRNAITLALENNNRIKAAQFTSQAAKRGIKSANSRYLPAISFEESLIASNSPTNTFMMKLDEGRFTSNDFLIRNLNTPSATHDFKTELSIQQPLFVPSLSPRKELAVKDAQKSELEVEAAREGTAFQVFFTYLDAQKTAAQSIAAEKAVTDAREKIM